MKTNKYKQFFDELLETFDTTGTISTENTIKIIKNVILTLDLKNNSTKEEVLLPQCVTMINFLVNNNKTLTEQECDKLFNILSECSSAINSKIYTLKRKLNSIKAEINSDEMIKYGNDYRAFKTSASNKLTEEEIKNMYLIYISNR